MTDHDVPIEKLPDLVGHGRPSSSRLTTHVSLVGYGSKSVS